MSVPLKTMRVIVAVALAAFWFSKGGLVLVGVGFVATQATYMLLRHRRARTQKTTYL